MPAVTYRCPKCKIEAVINVQGKTKNIKHTLDANRPQFTFPTHADCELVKPVAKIDFTKLQRVG